ncbi:LOW QUALITY PROTEIN: uncharacterized protein EMH_0058180 [Eimeria mitis]|uniref:Conserved oligomeric Golgi complex subunit 8 n=1 Tax=Eimeria mitis TaxID=44415 RepID=U6JYF8_9EIME|nr:LOW QUALITY PROTEIN: uncharacterized protein EMH_0058180 [Eimeria mitis]CDJ30444.1 hypothetical protein, conserved [Eimeria mitis]
MQSSVSGLLDLPSLVLKCSNGGLYDEAVDVMMLADERIASLRASGCCGMPLLDFLEMQWFARGIRHTESLKLHLCLRFAVSGLRAASELLRVDVLQTAINYRAIFGSTDGRLSAWLAEQVHWFVKLLDKELLQRTEISEPVDGDSIGARASLDLAAVEAGVTQKNVRPVPKFRVGLLDLATILRQVHTAATAFRRVQCYFFPVAALTFDRYVVAMHRRRLEEIAAAFARSIDEYDCVPSTAHLSLLGTSPWFQSCLSANRSCVFLLRHAPLSNLYNSILEVANAFQECPISTTAPVVVSLIESLLAFCIRKLISVKPGRRENFEAEINAIEQRLVQKDDGREGSVTQAEFFVLCDIFATVLLPAVAQQLSSTFPLPTGLATEELRSLMASADLCRSPNPFTDACSARDEQPTGLDSPTDTLPVVP